MPETEVFNLLLDWITVLILVLPAFPALIVKERKNLLDYIIEGVIYACASFIALTVTYFIFLLLGVEEGVTFILTMPEVAREVLFRIPRVLVSYLWLIAPIYLLTSTPLRHC